MGVTNYLWNNITDTVAMEKDGAGNTTAVYQSDPVPFGRLRSMRRGGKTYNYHFDGRGNTTYLTDQTGKKTDAYTYGPFGTPRTATGSTQNPYRYGGQHGYQYNESTDDYYVRARPYDPKQARWQSKDPLRFADGLNPYVYAGNGPVSGVDPSGFTCATGIKNVLGRGSFIDVHLAGVPRKSRWFANHVGSLFGAVWQPNARQFRSLKCGCCCEEIGFVQLVNSMRRVHNTLTGRTTETRARWHVDIEEGARAVNYPYGIAASSLHDRNKAYNPTGTPCPGTTIGMYDFPREPISRWKTKRPSWPFSTWGYPSTSYTLRLLHLKQDYETCVVCLKGREGIKTTTEKPGAFTIIPRTHLSQLITYGCITWGHEWLRSPKHSGGYIVRRHLNGVIRKSPNVWTNRIEDGTNPTWYRSGFGKQIPNPATAKPPSARFVSILKTRYSSP